MIEPPSQQLVESLARLRLCAPRDLRRCRRRVRRLAHDLPAFDSIWIDALLQARKLTSFQARMIETGQARRLAVGPCVLVAQLGSGTGSQTYLARRGEGREQCVLKLVEVPAESRDARFAALEDLARRTATLAHPNIVAPHTALIHEQQIVAVSRDVHGPHLGELLIRRGRFPADVVLQIARQLVDGLAALEERGCVHGDVLLRNVRLTTDGNAVLVDAGIRPATEPHLPVHAGLKPERCDAVAPELIGTGYPASSASDIYALGCLLWHLLAGRPPFPTGDALLKLAAHQTREMVDVREWSPDTPPLLARAIHVFTQKDPRDRPQSFREVREKLGGPRVGDRRRLAKFRAMFNTGAPSKPAKRSSRAATLPLAAALLIALGGAAFTLADKGARTWVLSIRTQVVQAIERTEFLSSKTPETPAPASEESIEAEVAPTGRQPLPAPDAEGVIELAAAQYDASDVSAVGPLTIRGPRDGLAEIVVTAQPLNLWAETMQLENVRVRRDAAASSTLLAVNAQRLSLRHCLLDAAATAINWTVLDPSEPRGGRLEVIDSALHSAGPAIEMSTANASADLKNVLKTGSGALLASSAVPAPGRELRLRLERTTLRGALSLVQLVPPESAEQVSAGRIRVDAADCVFDLEGENAALFQFVSSENPVEQFEAVEMAGSGSLACIGLQTAAWLPPDAAPTNLDDASFVALEGIVVSELTYAGEATGAPRNSAVTAFHAPRRSSQPPGVDPAALPSSDVITDETPVEHAAADAARWQ